MADEPKSSSHVGNDLIACSHAGKWSLGGRDNNLLIILCGPFQEGKENCSSAGPSALSEITYPLGSLYNAEEPCPEQDVQQRKKQLQNTLLKKKNASPLHYILNICIKYKICRLIPSLCFCLLPRKH